MSKVQLFVSEDRKKFLLVDHVLRIVRLKDREPFCSEVWYGKTEEDFECIIEQYMNFGYKIR